MLEMSENSDSEATMSSSTFPTSSVTIAAPKPSQEEAAIISTQPNIDTEPFYLESDCVSLRNNADYSCLLKTLVLLEAQRVQACQDLERLIDLREHALDPNTRPSEFVKNELPRLELPERQKVYCLPQIDWSRYFDSATTTAVGSTPGAMSVSGGALDSDCLEAIRLQNSLNRATRSTRIQQQQAKVESTRKSSRQQQQSDQEAASGQESGGGGRKKPGNERNFNKPWTVEEQRRLEELLIEIPPEENEASRWRKIAEKLGTRSQLQVQSHCQKYFIKLAKAGLPIPGRMPNLRTYKSKKGTRGRAAATARDAYGLGRATNTDLTGRRIVGRGVSLNQISSMWTSFNPPMIMNDENETIDQRELDFLNDHDDDDDDQNEDNDEEEGEDDEGQESDDNQEEENNFEQFENADENLQNQQSEIPYNIKEEPIDNDDDYSIAKTSSQA